MNGIRESPDRPLSELLVDLHIFIVPSELWSDPLRSAANEVKEKCISAGFIRFSPDITMYELRVEIEQQLEDEMIPKNYAFLRSVGSRFTRLKAKQEKMKAKYFAEPWVPVSELYLLPDAQFLPSSGGSSDRSSLATMRRYNGSAPTPGLPHVSRSQARPNDYTHDASPYNSVDAKNTARRSRGGNVDSPHPYVHADSDRQVPHRHADRKPDNKHHSANNSHDSGIHEPNMEELEKRRMQEILRRQQEEEERRRWEQEEEERQRRAAEEAERRRREIEEAEARRQKEIEEEAERRKREQEEAEAERKRRWEEDERRRREEERRRWEEEERRREEDRRREEERREEEERQRKEEEERRRAEEERKRQEEEEEERLRELEKERYPSPPELDQADEKERLLRELSLARSERHEIERRREDLVRKAKQLQTKAANRRNQARDIWKKKYFEEKKKTAPLEDQCNKLRQELEQLHRKLVTQLEGSKDTGRRTPHPSQQSSQKVAATKLQHEIEDLSRRVENVKMKLTAEMKLRNQAETELRALRAELTQKKINVTLSRSQQMNALGSSHDMYRPITPFATPRNG